MTHRPGAQHDAGPTRQRAGGEDRRDRSRPEPPPPLAAPVADSHCHLDIADGPGGRWLPVEDAVARAAAVGVPRIVQIGCDLPGARWAVQAAEEHPALVAGVALHPNEVPVLAAAGELDAALAEIDRLAGSSPRVRAVGETGLDHFRTGEEGWKVQEDGFRAHIALAKKHGKALAIHDRDAHDDVLRVLAEEGAPERVLMHCFSGDAEMARECVRRGYYLSFAGTVTFKNAAPLREALAEVPLGRILVETDAPYLAPSPHRGRPNASYLVPLTIRCMAEVKGVSEEAMCVAVAEATEAVFGAW
ncbi:TatD DNase family protein [Actinopolymorpha cephalotaxi]|uniref:TatD DNase family protein n=1 Tax=Actinopolymorpha cephalotaxi TaxID=504797 RepID=A0A1I2M052_9ACTN|nr:TatD family hydrolase [Actinopolymorpha cephalotaxi]NYH81497.1 TatD DNase family protein [Actinopolymorpha cephalotaxi]SFF84099.1 TatD DNase family protein [Actinopolymorpha cephalotaxi]